MNRVFLNKELSKRTPTCCSVTPKDHILPLAELRQERIFPPGRMFFVRKKRRKQPCKLSNIKRKNNANEFQNCSVFYLDKFDQTLDITPDAHWFFLSLKYYRQLFYFCEKSLLFYKGWNRYAVNYKSEQTKLNLFTIDLIIIFIDLR